MYVSEITRFIADLKANNPEIATDQARGRALWWDKKPITPDESERTADSRVKQKPYVYQTGR